MYHILPYPIVLSKLSTCLSISNSVDGEGLGDETSTCGAEVWGFQNAALTVVPTCNKMNF